VARGVLVPPSMKTQNHDQNQGEGDRRSSRRYNRDVQRFVADGKVEGAAEEAKQYVERHPSQAARDEAKARKGPGASATVDELIAKGRTIVDRIKPVVERVTQRVRRSFKKSK
jgi:hypothetical protein